MQDTDHGERRIHCNSNRLGFLNSSSSWSFWSDDAGRIESVYGANFGNGTLSADGQNDVFMFASGATTGVAQAGAFHNKLRILGGSGQSRDLQLYQVDSEYAHIGSSYSSNQLTIDSNFTQVNFNNNLQINSHVINMDLNNLSDNAIELREVRDSTWPFMFVTNDVGNDNQSGFWVGSNGYPDMRLRRENSTVRALISSWERSYVSNGFSISGGTLDMTNNNITNVEDIYLNDRIYHNGDTDTYLQFEANDVFRIVIAGAELQEWGNNYTRLNDNDTLRLGSGSDFRMWHDGSHTYFRNYNHAAGNIYIQGEDLEGTNTNLISGITNVSQTYVQLWHDNVERLRTLSGGVGVTGLTVGDVDANPHNSNGLQVSNANNEKIVLSGSTSPFIRWQEGTTDKAYIQWSSAGYLDFRNQENGQFKFESTVDGQACSLILMRNDTTTASGDDLGSINFGHTDGDPDFPVQTVTQLPARIVAEATEATGGGDDGARLRFFTKPTNGDKASSSLERMRIDQNGTTHFYGSIDLNNYNIIDVEDIGLQDRIYHDGDTDTYIQFHATDQWRVVTGGAERLEVNNSQITSTEPIHAPSFHGDGSSLTGIESGANDDIFWENGQNVTSNYTITNGKNAMSAGPITVNSGVTVTVGDGETWTVV